MAGQVTGGRRRKPGKALGFILGWGRGGCDGQISAEDGLGNRLGGSSGDSAQVPRSPPSALAISIAPATMAPRVGQDPAAVKGATAHGSSFPACNAAFVHSLGRRMARGGLPCPSLRSRRFIHPDPGWPTECED